MNRITKFITRALIVLLALQAPMLAQLLIVQRAQAAGMPTTQPQVVINEVMWTGSYVGTTSHASDEWIELFNTTSSDVSLSGWQLTNTGLPVFASTTAIPANSYFLISNYDIGDASTILNVAPDLVDSSISLNNTCTEIDLVDSTNQTIDQMGCDGTSYFAGLNDTTNHVRASMERSWPIADGTLASSWQTSSVSGNLIDVATGSDLATPRLPSSTVITNFVGSDVTGDHGGAVALFWDATTNPNVIGYQLSYYQTSADPNTAITQTLGVVDSATISGLTNTPDSYIFTLTALAAGNELLSAPVTATVSAIDDFLPTLDRTQVIVAQNVPGTSDTIAGGAAASNDPGATVFLYGQDPTITLTPNLVGQATVQPDGSFPAIDLGDNLYGQVWVVVGDAGSGLTSTPELFSNDVVAPKAPVLNSLHSTCQSDRCDISLGWQEASSDAISYNVITVVDGRSMISPNLTDITSAMMFIPGKTYAFTVTATDAAGNISVSSNQFSLPLTANTITDISLKNGQPVTVTTVIPVSQPTPAPATVVAVATKPTPSFFTPALAHAQEVVPSTTTQLVVPTTPSENSSTTTSTPTSNQDWWRVIAAVVLLLLTAAGFLVLARSFAREDSSPTPPTAPTRKRGRPAKNAVAEKEATVVKRPRGRPKGSTKKPLSTAPKRPRGRPRKNP